MEITLKKETGLTLIELLMTILIIAILSSLVLPRINSLGILNLRTFARKFAGEINYYFTQSVFKKVSYKIVLDLNDKNSYSILKYSEGEWVPEKSKILLPDGVFFHDIISSPQNLIINSGDGEIKFTSIGIMDGVTIHLSDGKNSYYSLLTNSITGKVTIFDKYVKRE